MKPRLMLLAFAFVASSAWAQAVPNFTGEWILIPEKSSFPESRPQGLSVQANIVHDSSGIQSSWTIASSSDSVELKLRFTTDGSPTFNPSGRNERAFELLTIPSDKRSLGEDIEVTGRWEGRELKVVSKWYNPNKRGVELDDTWTLSSDKNTLTINRTAEPQHPTTGSAITETHTVLLFRRHPLPQRQANAGTKIVHQPIEPKQDTKGNTPGPTPAPVMVSCRDGSSAQKAEDCGLRNGTISNNIYRNGATPDLSNTHQTTFNNNLVLGSPRQTVTVSGEDTSLTHNTFNGTNVDVTKDARKTFISDNLFEPEPLVVRISDNQGNVTERDALLHQIREAFEERWKGLPPDEHQANEKLLEQFEASARSSAFDMETAKAWLQKVIDATPKPVSHENQAPSRQ